MKGRKIGFLIAGMMLLGCSSEKVAEESVLRPVRVTRVRAVAQRVDRVFSGYARASEESRLSFKVPGTLKHLAVKVGDTLEPGDAVATLDDRDFRLKVQEAEAGLVQARAGARNASLSYERARRLWEDDNISKSDLDGARAAWESAGAGVTSIGKRLELARRQLGYTRLRAPFGGSVTAVLAEENENTGAGVPVVVMASSTGIEVHVDIPEVVISALTRGQKATVRFAAEEERSFSATVYEVGTAATGFAATYPVSLSLDDEGTGVKPGMAAEVTFGLGQGEGHRLLVPSHVVGKDDQGPFLYVAKAEAEGEAVVKKVSVTVGGLMEEGLEITSGLSGREWVVTAGMSRLEEGMRVGLKVNGSVEMSEARP